MSEGETTSLREYVRRFVKYELDGVCVGSAIPHGYVGQAVYFRGDPDNVYFVMMWPTDLNPPPRDRAIQEARKQRGIFEWGSFPADNE